MTAHYHLLPQTRLRERFILACDLIEVQRNDIGEFFLISSLSCSVYGISFMRSSHIMFPFSPRCMSHPNERHCDLLCATSCVLNFVHNFCPHSLHFIKLP